jgi:PRC-barrel domain
MKSICSVLALVAATSVAGAQTPVISADGPSAQVIRVHHEADANAGPVQIMTSLPAESLAFTQWQKQSVYDLNDNKIGDVMDILMDHDGKPVAAIIGVGGFLGVGEKDVAVPFNAVHFKMKDQKWQLVMNASKDALKSAQGFRYDRTAMKWVPEVPAATIGGSPRAR